MLWCLRSKEMGNASTPLASSFLPFIFSQDTSPPTGNIIRIQDGSLLFSKSSLEMPSPSPEECLTIS